MKRTDLQRGVSAVVPAPVKVTARRIVYLGRRYACPVCGAHVRRWLQYKNRPAVRCPVCAAQERHRLAWWFLVHRWGLFSLSTKRILHFAPELGWQDRLRSAPGVDYLSGDLDPEKAMRCLDITSLDLVDRSFDLVLCSHVLEHVPDDRAAMEEIYRVLRPGGHALVLVPLREGSTDEDLLVTDPSERVRRFGQKDHVRRYGTDDLGDRLHAARFEVTQVRAKDLMPPADQRRFGLTGGHVLWWCRRPA